jgi:hypothetical protein
VNIIFFIHNTILILKQKIVVMLVKGLLIGSTNIHRTSNFGPPHELINREIHHFQGGTYQIDRRTEQRATLGSRSEKRHLLSDKPFEYSNDISKSLEQLRLGSEERQHKFDWDRKDNYRLANSLDFSKRLDSRGGARLDSRDGPRLNSRGGPRPMLDSRSGDRIRLSSFGIMGKIVLICSVSFMNCGVSRS